MAKLANYELDASVVAMTQFDSENPPHQFVAQCPGGFWLIVGGPVLPDQPTNWRIDRTKDRVRVPLIPYLTVLDDLASSMFQLQLGLVVGQTLPKQYAARVARLHIVFGDTVDGVTHAGKECARQFIGIAAWVKGAP